MDTLYNFLLYWFAVFWAIQFVIIVIVEILDRKWYDFWYTELEMTPEFEKELVKVLNKHVK